MSPSVEIRLAPIRGLSSFWGYGAPSGGVLAAGAGGAPAARTIELRFRGIQLRVKNGRTFFQMEG